MKNRQLEDAINKAWEDRDEITPASKGAAREAIDAALAGLMRVICGLLKRETRDGL